MPFTAQQLIHENQNLVAVEISASLKKALDLMIQNDFSQLPVVHSDQTLKGMITSDGVVRAVSHFGLNLDQLKVSHAYEKVKAYRQDDEISEILKGLKEKNAVAITNKNSELKGIVTSFDTTEYFRRRAEDIMLAEDIETTLRDFIEAAHRDENGDSNQDKLNNSIEAITPSGNDLQDKFKGAICRYLSESHPDNSQPNIPLINQLYQDHLRQPTQPKAFEDLTLFEYIALFKNVWEDYQATFHHMEWEAIEKLLNEVRQTRNAIAHFREITPQQREQLQFCANFLDRHRSSLDEIQTQQTLHTLLETDRQKALLKAFKKHWPNLSGGFIATSPKEEDLDPNDSRYAPLALWLESQSDSKVLLSFSDIETIIQDSLPPSARKHRNWWANDAVSHTQSQQWLEAGWRVSSVNMNLEKVEFKAIEERQSAYIKFFSHLKSTLLDIPNNRISNTSNPQGRNWFPFEVVSEGDRSYFLVFCFARRSRFCLELYIDTGEQEQNKAIFDAIYQHRDHIESDLGQPLSWERLDSKRGSRIALYREMSSITDPPDQLEEVQNWAVEHFPLFFEAISNNTDLNSIPWPTAIPTGN